MPEETLAIVCSVICQANSLTLLSQGGVLPKKIMDALCAEDAAKIHANLGKVLDYLKGRMERDMHPIEFASIVHHRFMRCFPFSKFSGMLGRLTINFVLDRHGYLPAVIHSTDRQRYYEALRGPEKNFRAFLVEAMENSLENASRFFAADTAARAQA